MSRNSTGKVIGGIKPKEEVFVAFDVAKARNSVSIAEGGRHGEVRYFGEIDDTFEATRKLILKLASRYQSLTFFCEAGRTGYGLYRWIKRFGYECLVVALSLIPSRADDRVRRIVEMRTIV